MKTLGMTVPEFVCLFVYDVLVCLVVQNYLASVFYRRVVLRCCLMSLYTYFNCNNLSFKFFVLTIILN